MRIIYTHDIFSFQPYGGISRYLAEVIRRIPAEEARIQVFAGLHVNQYLKGLPGVIGVKVPIFGNVLGSRVLNGVMQILRKNVNDLLQVAFLEVDNQTVLHLSDYTRAPIKGGARVVVTVHDMIFELFPQFYPQHERLARIKKRCCERANKIIAVSNCTKRDLVRLLGIDPGKVEVIYHGNCLGEVVPEAGRVTLRSPYLLFVGDRRGYKNFEALLETFARSPRLHTHFTLVCFGGGHFSSHEKRRLSDLKVDSLVRYVEGDDPLLAAYYRCARALIYPSLYEGFGIPPLEAMSCGCPVICSDRGPIPEVVADAGVYFDPENEDHMQHILETVLFDDARLQDLARRGLERQATFSWDRTARETLALYRSLL